MQQYSYLTCPQCGSLIKPGQMHCTHCGSPIVYPNYNHMGTPTPNYPKPKTNNTAVYIMLAVIIILVIVIASIILFPLFSDNSTEVSKTPEPDKVYEEQKKDETPTPTPNKKAKKELKTVSTYSAHKSDDTWEEAYLYARDNGGHLIYINTAEEFTKACNMADSAGIKVFWAGAQRLYNQAWYDTCWLDGNDMNYTHWLSGEPSYYSEEGYDEYYLMVFKVGDEWYYNDSIGDVSEYYPGKMGFIVEYEEVIG